MLREIQHLLLNLHARNVLKIVRLVPDLVGVAQERTHQSFSARLVGRRRHPASKVSRRPTRKGRPEPPVCVGAQRGPNQALIGASSKRRGQLAPFGTAPSGTIVSGGWGKDVAELQQEGVLEKGRPKPPKRSGGNAPNEKSTSRVDEPSELRHTPFEVERKARRFGPQVTRRGLCSARPDG